MESWYRSQFRELPEWLKERFAKPWSRNWPIGSNPILSAHCVVTPLSDTQDKGNWLKMWVQVPSTQLLDEYRWNLIHSIHVVVS